MTHRHVPLRRSTLAIALAVSTFALAPATGSADPPHGRHARSPGMHRGPDPARIHRRMQQLAERVTQHLELDEERSAKVRAILQRAAERAERLLRERPRGPERRLALMKTRLDALDEVYALLRCEEKDRFRTIERRWREEHARRRMMRRMHRGGHGRHGPRGHARPGRSPAR